MYKVVRLTYDGLLTSVICRPDSEFLRDFYTIYRDKDGVIQTVPSGFCFPTLVALKGWTDTLFSSMSLEVWSVEFEHRKLVTELVDCYGGKGWWRVPRETWECFNMRLKRKIY
jgi:hypothetical protein